MNQLLVEKYAKFLVEGCLKLTNEDKLFIIGNDLIEDFIEVVFLKAQELGIKEIKKLVVNVEYQKELYLTKNYEEIINDPVTDRTMYNDYAKEGYAFLSLSSPMPGYLSDVNPELLRKIQQYQNEKTTIFREYQEKDLIKWNISAVPNAYWADKMGISLDELWADIFKICLINEVDNPIILWNEKLEKLKMKADYLNGLKIKKLIYQNSLGTNLELELPKNYLFQSALSKNIVNMPTEEVFTSPVYSKTNGIVYASKPLEHQGNLIENFYLEFKDGKVVNFGASKGKEILNNILEEDETSSYLGEVALVDFDSPISKINKIFYNTLIDENASCHLALGQSFLECISDGFNKSKEELKKAGLNFSKAHVDFFIGTNDLLVKAILENGEEKIIMQNGNFYWEENL